MNIHEHQAKEILKEFGAPVSNGVVINSIDEIKEKISKLNTKEFVLKAQIHAGGRGKAGGVKLVKNLNILNFVIIYSTIAFLFNQLITANQIYIFSLIPILAAVIHVNLNSLKIDPKTFYIILFVVLFASVKFHLRFNIDRKFHDLENIDKSKAVKANIINENFKSLKWISKFDQPNNELTVIKEALKVIDGDNREKTLITHYQFISTFLDKPLNILNRWYLWDNNTHPTENHKYFEFYKSLVDKNIKKNKVKVVYLLGQKNEINFKNVKNYFTDTCFKSKTIVPDRFSMHEIVKCKK